MMKSMSRKIGIALMMFSVMFIHAVSAQTVYEVKSHSIIIEGTSNLHDWTAEAGSLNGTFKLKVENGKLVDIENLSIKINAQSLKGSKGSVMDSKISEALNAKKHPEITFELRKVNSITENPGVYRINTLGQLKISGVTKPVTLSATGKIIAGGEIEFSGSTKLKMTDFDVTPPRAMFGALTTGDEITLNFNVVVKPSRLSGN
jgi:polyisoprenoid-binding protein YceI